MGHSAYLNYYLNIMFYVFMYVYVSNYEKYSQTSENSSYFQLIFMTKLQTSSESAPPAVISRPVYSVWAPVLPEIPVIN